jgi:hypothetical protein
MPKPYEVSGGLAELPYIINMLIKAWGASPSLFCFTNNKVQNRPSSEPDEVINYIGSRRTLTSKLHIDDGSMDGGTEIPYEPIVNYVNSDNSGRLAGPNNDFLDFKWGENWDTDSDSIIDPGEDISNGYFSPSRRGIFHYCLFVHDMRKDGSTNKDGAAEIMGDDLMVDDGQMYPKVMDQAQTFMHELGHNLGLPDVDHAGSGYKSVMNYDWEESWGLVYTSGEWNQINLAYVNSSPD